MKTKSEKILPLAAMAKLMKKAGAARVGDDAAGALREYLEEHAVAVGERAWTFAQHSGRRTVKESDVKLAVKG
ncbi:MAG TPA: histone [Candidatus Nanoarchaeia archaeon]|nr:histone [Candidatus Nanoarchaeia archaeon]